MAAAVARSPARLGSWPMVRCPSATQAVAWAFFGQIASAGAATCEILPLTQPAPNAMVTADQADLRWAPHPSHNHRLQIRISQPEGPALQTIDLNTRENTWRIPASIVPPAGLASVQVQVTADCPSTGMDELIASPPAFFMVQPFACQLDPNSLKLKGNTLSWAPALGAQTYRVQIGSISPQAMSFSGNSPETWLPPKLHISSHFEVQAAEVALGKALESDGKTRAPPVVTVQPICSGRPGMPLARALSTLQQR